MIREIAATFDDLERMFGVFSGLRIVLLLLWPVYWAAWQWRASLLPIHMPADPGLPAPWEVGGRLVATAAELLAAGCWPG